MSDPTETKEPDAPVVDQGEKTATDAAPAKEPTEAAPDEAPGEGEKAPA